MRISAAVSIAIVVFGMSVFAGQSDVAKLKLAPQSTRLTLEFRNSDFPDVCQMLGKAVGIEIRLAPDVKAKPLTMKFTNANFEGVFTTIMDALNLNYTVVDETTVLITTKVVP